MNSWFFADVFPHADEVSDGDVNGEFLATFSPQGIGEHFAGMLPTAGQYVEQTFLILELDGEETLICDDNGFGRISDRVHRLLLLMFSMGQSNTIRFQTRGPPELYARSSGQAAGDP